jgi:hypothetical protein
MMLPEVNASTKIDERKTLLLPVNNCVRIPVSFGDAVNLVEVVVEESHSENFLFLELKSSGLVRSSPPPSR